MSWLSPLDIARRIFPGFDRFVSVLPNMPLLDFFELFKTHEELFWRVRAEARPFASDPIVKHAYERTATDLYRAQKLIVDTFLHATLSWVPQKFREELRKRILHVEPPPPLDAPQALGVAPPLIVGGVILAVITIVAVTVIFGHKTIAEIAYAAGHAIASIARVKQFHDLVKARKEAFDACISSGKTTQECVTAAQEVIPTPQAANIAVEYPTSPPRESGSDWTLFWFVLGGVAALGIGYFFISQARKTYGVSGYHGVREVQPAHKLPNPSYHRGSYQMEVKKP